MLVASNTVVSFHYVLRNDAGEVIDRSGDDPFAYLHGHGNIVTGLEQALEGRGAGDTLEVRVPPESGYGERSDELVQAVPRSAFEGVSEAIEPGMRFRAGSGEGARIVTITEVGADAVTVDANHPLAGETLHFDVEVTGVRVATDVELEHGHVHDGSEAH